jgi:hypothetical protein
MSVVSAPTRAGRSPYHSEPSIEAPNPTTSVRRRNPKPAYPRAIRPAVGDQRGTRWPGTDEPGVRTRTPAPLAFASPAKLTPAAVPQRPAADLTYCGSDHLPKSPCQTVLRFGLCREKSLQIREIGACEGFVT